MVASPKISIITVCFNSVLTIRDTIESVLRQDYADIEYIIVDGASTDGTMGIVQEYKGKISIVVSEQDHGIYDAMNKGIALATGDVVGCINSDDLYINSGVLSRVANTMLNSDVKTCYADLVYVDRLNTDQIVRWWKSSVCEKELFELGWVPAHPTFFVRKEIYDTYGVFDTDYLLAADYELMTRFLYKNSVKAEYIPFVMVKMRLGGQTSKSLSNIMRQNIEIIRACKKNSINMRLLPFFFSKIVNRLSQYIKRTR